MFLLAFLKEQTQTVKTATISRNSVTATEELKHSLVLRPLRKKNASENTEPHLGLAVPALSGSVVALKEHQSCAELGVRKACQLEKLPRALQTPALHSLHCSPNSKNLLPAVFCWPPRPVLLSCPDHLASCNGHRANRANTCDCFCLWAVNRTLNVFRI